MLGNMWAQTSGIRNFAISSIRGDNEQFPLTFDDAAGIFKQWRELSDVLRFRVALNTGKWTSSTGTPLSDVSPSSALFQTITGLTNQKTADVTISAKALKQESDLNAATEKAFITAVQKAQQAARDNDPEQSLAYLKQAKAIMGPLGDYPQEKRPQLWKRALSEKDTLDDQLMWNFLMRNPPASKAIPRQQTYERINEIRQQEKVQ